MLMVRDDFTEMLDVAESMAKSGYFRDANDKHKAVVKILAGREMGLGPFASMTGIHLIQGKPELSANALAAMIKNHPVYDYRVTELTHQKCSIDFREGSEVIGTSEFTTEDARKAGLQGGNWSKYTRNMLFARAMSNGAKWFTPGIFGGSPVYSEGEIGGTENVPQVDIIDVEPVDISEAELAEVSPGGMARLAEELGGTVSESSFDEDNLINAPTDEEKDESRAVVAGAIIEGQIQGPPGKMMSATKFVEYLSENLGFTGPHHVRATIKKIYGNPAVPNDSEKRRALYDILTKYRALRAEGLSGDDALAQLQV